MVAGARTALTLGVLAVLLVAGAAWGWATLTQPFGTEADSTTCRPTTIAAGDEVTPAQVTVSVLNAGTRAGLAGRTMSLLTDAGFVEGDSDNAPEGSGVTTAQIWTDEPGTPAVRLVRSWLPEGTEVQRRDTSGAGVVVVVGDDFTELREGRASVVAREDSELCTPPG